MVGERWCWVAMALLLALTSCISDRERYCRSIGGMWVVRAYDSAGSGVSEGCYLNQPIEIVFTRADSSVIRPTPPTPEEP